MSTDTEKEDESVVDSSVTQKNDVRNIDDPDNFCHRLNEDGLHSAEEEQENSENVVKHSYPVKKACSTTKYFIIKSLNHNNIQLSIQRGIWATQVMNEPILEEAFRNSDKVVLIFSVNMSGFFQGYAQMMSSVGWRRDNAWSQGTGGNNPWGRSFKVKWLQLSNLPFHKTLHLKNPLNDYKPVKISRDCQELPADIGEALCELIDKEMDEVEKGVRDDFRVRWPEMDPACSLPNEGYIHTYNTSWGRGPVQYPPHLNRHHHHHHEAVAPHTVYQGLVGAFHPGSSISPESPKFGYAHQKGNAGDTWDTDTSPQLNGWGPSGGEVGPYCSNITEDEFLEMSYEEYLEALSGGSKKRSNPAVAPLKAKKSSSKSEDDDLSALSDQGRNHKRSHH